MVPLKPAKIRINMARPMSRKRVCHICSLRLRALYKVKACTMCKTELQNVLFTKSSTKSYRQSDVQQIPFFDNKLQIYFEEADAMEDSMILLRFNCPDSTCDVSCPNGWGQLKAHVKRDHGMLMCDLCTRHKKIFTHEHALYTQAALQRHYKSGGPDDPSFKGHPECGFCKISFYGDDELYSHCREKHEQCFLCQRAGVRNQYYVNYESLYRHFQGDHFPCNEPECLEQKFVVFASDLDLKAHQMEDHRDVVGRKAKKQTIDVGFTYAGSPTRAGDERARPARGNRDDGNHGRDGGQPRNQYALPAGSTPRENIPDRRPIATPPAPPVSENNAPPGLSRQPQRKLKPPPGFGSQFSSPTAVGDSNSSNISTASNSALAPPSVTQHRPNSPSKSPLDASRITTNNDLNNSLINLLSTTPSSISEFRESLRLFKSENISADELLEKIISVAMIGRGNVAKLKKETEDNVVRVWKQLAGTLESEGCSGDGVRGMLRALNDWKVKRSEGSTVSQPSYAQPVSSTSLSSSSSSNNNGDNAYLQSFPAPPTRSTAKPQARILVIKSASSRQGAHGWSTSSGGGVPVRRIGSNGSSSSPSNASIWDRLADEVIAKKSSDGEISASDYPTPGPLASSSSGQQQQPTFVETAARPHITSPVSYPPLLTPSSSSSTSWSRPMASTTSTTPHRNNSNSRNEMFPALASAASAFGANGDGGMSWGQTEALSNGSSSSGKKKKKGREKNVVLHFG
ncbi:hypothetical protein SeMB42_g06312 [Synchytrium endobioticum]|uniref:C2H2-type domain-containing protein n=1 Tax=Synchytrium endobioticum TaxID=286115 RepID=A0A507CEU5_9FUNG|nr:hypothetical protein SeMB42_g06312 [Synchytrium endobioticum]